MNPIAACYGWACWSNVCGFLVIAAPQIIFLATFLLLLSFWVDLCHQATDREEEEDEEDEENPYERLPSCENSRSSDKPRWCCLTFKQWRVRGRQKFVVLLVLGIFILTSAFAALIWYGTGDNPIDSATMAEVYADLFAFVVLLSGGGLASYGLLLYSKMCKVKTGKSSADIRKVAGLALAAVVCFSLRAFLVLFGDIPVINVWHWELQSHICPLLTFLYYVIGEAIPSIVILCVMREMPPRSRNNSVKGKTIAEESLRSRLNDQMVSDSSLFPQWTISATGQSYLIHPARSSSDISITRNEPAEETTRAVASG
jgi:uncharacterized membrane protein